MSSPFEDSKLAMLEAEAVDLRSKLLKAKGELREAQEKIRELEDGVESWKGLESYWRVLAKDLLRKEG